MRWLPQTLFGRLVLVLLGGLAVAQLVSFSIHMSDRGALLQRASGLQSAQRIADTVRLLDDADPAGRRKIVNVLSAPPLAVRLDQPRMSPRGGDASAPEAVFGTMLRQLLGEAWPVETVVAEGAVLPGVERRGGDGFHGPMRGPMGGGHGGAMHGAGRGGLAFVAQVRLRDGTLVTFDARQSELADGWPLRMLLSLGVLLVAVVGLSLLAVHWATRPLKALADAADALGHNLASPPMPEGGPVEVARAARAFNTMQVRLAAHLRERTSVLAAMSHDLKTPVTRMRLRAELLPDDQVRRKFTLDLEELESLVTATLDYLRGAGGTEAAQPVDINALLESLQADLAETGGEVRITGNVQRPYVGQPNALKRCIRNLVENAVNYGQSAEVIVEDDAAGLRIAVRDRGPGIPPAELDKVFEPFYRLEGSRNRDTGGTGLGLTIARSIAQAHGGELMLANRAEGGLEASLRLPRPVVAEAA